MKPDKQRIAIAEYCGWTNCHIGSPSAGGAVDRPGRPVGTPPDRKYTCELPNYTGCLNAMYEAEKRNFIGPREWGQYCDTLRWVMAQFVERKCGFGSCCGIMCLEAAVGATAAERAEAFLRTIGKWEE